MYCEAKKDENVQKFSKDLEYIVENLTKQLHQLSNQIRNPSLLDDDMSPSTAIETITYLKEDLETLSKNAKSFANYEDCFASALSTGAKKRTLEGYVYSSLFDICCNF